MAKPGITIGYTLQSEDVESVGFDSMRPLQDFEIAIVNWYSLHQKINTELGGSGIKYLTHASWEKYSSMIDHTNAMLNEFLSQNGLLVTLVSLIPTNLQYANIAGTLTNAGIDSKIPRQLSNAIETEGVLIEAAENLPNELKEFVDAVQGHLVYSAALTTDDGTPLMYIAGTNKPVSIWHPNQKGGGVLYLPFPRNSVESHRIIFQAIRKLSNKLKALQEENMQPLPEWHVQYRLGEETSLRNSQTELQAKLLEVNKSLESITTRLSEVIFLKRLMTDQGDSLLNTAAKGFTVKPGPEGRDDLILEGPDGNKLLVEVKGRDSMGALEADCAQLEKWVSGYLFENGIEPKGVLVMNGYCATPLKDRAEPVFPEQMLKYATRKEQCLISGYQLLAFVLAVQLGKISTDDIQETILNSVGISPTLPNISDCISLLEVEE